MFNHGDKVLSKRNTGMNLVAYVDMQVGDYVYISEWGKNLSNPYRLVVDESCLMLFNNKITITKKEFEDLVKEHLRIDGVIDNDKFTIGDIVNIRGYDYLYEGNTEDGDMILSYDNEFYSIDKKELDSALITKDVAAQKLFGISYNEINFIS